MWGRRSGDTGGSATTASIRDVFTFFGLRCFKVFCLCRSGPGRAPLDLKSVRKCFRPNLAEPTSQSIRIHAGGMGTVEYNLLRAIFGLPGPLYGRPSSPGRAMTTGTVEATILFDFGVWYRFQVVGICQERARDGCNDGSGRVLILISRFYLPISRS